MNRAALSSVFVSSAVGWPDFTAASIFALRSVVSRYSVSATRFRRAWPAMFPAA